jgi:predicted transcriptional regulator YdeE
MEPVLKESFQLVGIALKKKTINVNGQSSIDCGNLWQEFEKRNISAQISNGSEREIYAVYYDYDGDHTKPFSYFIGCKVSDNTEAPEGLDLLTIPESNYQEILAKGKMPDCVADSWQLIWNADFPRAYQYDFEVYDNRSLDWQNAEVDIFLSVNRDAKF